MTSSPWLLRLSSAVLLLAAISLVALVANLVVLGLLYPVIVALAPLPPWVNPALGWVVGGGHLVLGGFHLAALGTLGWQIKLLQPTGAWRPLVFAAGVLSLLMLAANVALLGDIGKEYRAGLDTSGEWLWVFGNHALHTLFVALGAVAIAHGARRLRTAPTPEPVELDDAVFLSAHYVGALSGLLGLGALGFLVATGFPLRFFGTGIRVFGAIALAPYLVVVGAWAVPGFARGAGRGLDEKQALDLARSARFTLLTTIPCFGAVYCLQWILVPGQLIPFLWFPFVGFSSLAVFSLATVWFSRRP